MILFDYNIFFSVDLVIYLYRLVEVLLVLMPCTYEERFCFSISLASDNFIFACNYMEVFNSCLVQVHSYYGCLLFGKYFLYNYNLL